MPGAEPSVLVTGATGLVGTRLVRALLDRGRGVRAATRNPARARLDRRARAVGWDGLDLPPESLDGVESIVHLAGEPVFAGPLTAARRERIRQSRVESTRRLVRAIARRPADRRPAVLVCASAVGIYGSRADEILDESAAPGEGFLADVCREWEAAAAEASASGLRVISLRIGIVLAREGGALPRLALPFRLGLGARLGDGRQWFPWIHIDDLVALAELAIASDALRGPLNAVGPSPVPHAELVQTLARLLHRPAFLRLPSAALRLALGELAGELLGSRRALPRAAQEAGFRFRHPALEEALAAELS